MIPRFPLNWSKVKVKVVLHPMGKHGFLTAKAISNRIKAKGLQRLRWYCQMCQKQCRDENGFRCHIQSESHQRQMKLFGENSSRFIDEFSEEFKSNYLKLLSSRYGTTRVFANQVYQELISDRTHVHMNATRWSTLSEFVKYLGREGLVHVDESERGFYVSWIDNSPATLARREAVQKMERQSRNQEDRDRHLIQEQIEKGQIHSASSSEPAATHLKRNEEEGKISIQLKRSAPISKMLNKSHKRANIGVINEAPEGEQDLPKEQDDQPVDEDRSWILPGIVVKVLDKKLANGKYYRQKGRIVNVVDEFIGEIEMLDSCDTIRVDQELLETSIPRAGESVIILVGPERGSRAKVLQIREQEYSADLELERSGALLKRVDYEHFSRVMK